jgi:hypothetical protein
VQGVPAGSKVKMDLVSADMVIDRKDPAAWTL